MCINRLVCHSVTAMYLHVCVCGTHVLNFSSNRGRWIRRAYPSYSFNILLSEYRQKGHIGATLIHMHTYTHTYIHRVRGNALQK